MALTDPPIIGLIAWLTAKRMGARFVFLCQDVFPEVANLLEDPDAFMPLPNAENTRGRRARRGAASASIGLPLASGSARRPNFAKACQRPSIGFGKPSS